MIPVKIQKISYHHPNRSYAVILKEIEGKRKLPVLVGAFEAQSIAMAMEFMETPRPLTHDLIVNLINGIDGKLSSVKITKLEDGIFYSILDIDCDDIGHREIDSRPSDALAIAIRMHSPILVADEVMREGVLLEDELDEISRGEKKWIPLMQEFWKPFIALVEKNDAEVSREDIVFGSLYFAWEQSCISLLAT